MSEEEEYELVACHQQEHSRTELRRYPDRWETVYLRPRVGGGWYVRNSIAVYTGIEVSE